MPRCTASLIVLAYNPASLTRRCLEALGPGCPDDWEVVIVDNGSTDDTSRLAFEFATRLPRIRTVRLERGETFARANNIGATGAAGERLVFLNNDIEARAEAVRVLVEAGGGPGGAGVAGTLLVYPGGMRVQHAGIRPMLWQYVSNWGSGGQADDPRWTRPGERFAVTAALLSIDRSLFERVGGFDEGYHWGYEDVDLFLAARAAGATVVYEPAAASIHAESTSLGSRGHRGTGDANFARYRSKWAHVLEPLERQYMDSMRRAQTQRVVVFGTGVAGRGLARQLAASGFEVVAFTSTRPPDDRVIDGVPWRALGDLDCRRYDRLLIGTQSFPEVESHLASHDPTGTPLVPVLD